MLLLLLRSGQVQTDRCLYMYWSMVRCSQEHPGFLQLNSVFSSGQDAAFFRSTLSRVCVSIEVVQGKNDQRACDAIELKGVPLGWPLAAPTARYKSRLNNHSGVPKTTNYPAFLSTFISHTRSQTLPAVGSPSLKTNPTTRPNKLSTTANGPQSGHHALGTHKIRHEKPRLSPAIPKIAEHIATRGLRPRRWQANPPTPKIVLVTQPGMSSASFCVPTVRLATVLDIVSDHR